MTRTELGSVDARLAFSLLPAEPHADPSQGLAGPRCCQFFVLWALLSPLKGACEYFGSLAYSVWI